MLVSSITVCHMAEKITNELTALILHLTLVRPHIYIYRLLIQNLYNKLYKAITYL